jgi:hypothetical protein
MAHAATDPDPQLVTTDRAERAVRARTLLGQAALLGVLADATVRSGPTGLGWTTLIAGLVTTILFLAVSFGERITRERVAWLAVALLAAAMAAWRDAEELRLLNFAATLSALGFAAMSFSGQPSPSLIGARVRDIIRAALNTALDFAGGTIALFRQADAGTVVGARSRAALPALRAAVLTVPLLFVFGSLLSNADPVFASLFNLPDIGLGTIASHLFVFAFFAWLCAGLLRGALAPATRPVPFERLPVTLGVVEIGTSLGALNVLFAAFVGVQARWLFGGAAVVEATTGLTVAEYARRGFFELVAVAALLAPVILITRAAAVDDVTIKRHRALSISLIVLLGAIMASAFSRMALYVSYYGLTTDRLYASVFMGWLAIVFAVMGLTLLRGWGKPFAAVAVIAGLATLGVLNAINPEAMVARSIVARGDVAPRGMDYKYLARLSGDAMPIAAGAVVNAQPSTDACVAARTLYYRATQMAGSEEWNWGAVSGSAAAERLITVPVVQRLCVNENPTNPTLTAPR